MATSQPSHPPSKPRRFRRAVWLLPALVVLLLLVVLLILADSGGLSSFGYKSF